MARIQELASVVILAQLSRRIGQRMSSTRNRITSIKKVSAFNRQDSSTRLTTISARTKLLVHLLMNTPHREMSTSGELKSDKLITAMVLKESLEQKKLESGNKDLRKKFSIIEQIIAVRTHLEQYEDGGIGKSRIVYAELK